MHTDELRDVSDRRSRSERTSTARTGAGHARPFVKSAGTTVPSERSRIQVERVLRRHGAKGFSAAQDACGKITLNFVVPDRATAASPDVPVQLHIDIRRLCHRLYGPGGSPGGEDARSPEECSTRSCGADQYDARKLEQAERVAWRHLLQWIDSTLTAASAGFQTISEAFFAHTVVWFDDGRRGRLVDYLESEQSHLAPGMRALLAVPGEDVAA